MSGRKKWLVPTLCAALCILMLTEFGITKVQEFCVTHQEEDWAPGLYLKAVWLYHITLRSEKAAEVYKQFPEDFPENEEMIPVVKYKYAESIEAIPKIYSAIKAYEAFVNEYPEHPLVPQARKKMYKLEAMR